MSSSKQSLKLSMSRLIAAQSLYQYDFYQGQKDINLLSKELYENYLLSEAEERTSSYLEKFDSDLLESLLSGVVLVLPSLDEDIKSFLKNENQLEDLPDLLLPILRLGSFELKFMKDTPTKVIINEYVDLAACFYEEKKVTFINKILQNIANKNRSEK